MPANLVIGLQWGDEGKGKVVDVLSEGVDMVVRFQGGANSGHTVKIGDRKFSLHCVPSGILRPGIQCVLGRGMVLDPFSLKDEIEDIKVKGVDIEGRIFISPRAHIVLPHHKLLDKALEAEAGKTKIGTTGRGIGPCYAEKAQRTGIQFGDLFHKEWLRERLELSVGIASRTLRYVYDTECPECSEVYDALMAIAPYYESYVDETQLRIFACYERGGNILFEGAQAVLLDLDAGTYPFVTSSTTTSAGVWMGAGFPSSKLNRATGVVKAYTTRVGEGPFPSEAFGESADYLRTKGAEYGTTTGRPRRTGWLDMVALKSVVKANGITDIVITKLDVLGGLAEILVVEAYDTYRGRMTELPECPMAVSTAKPVYRKFPGWKEDISDARSVAELPQAAQEYLSYISRETGMEISGVSVGQSRHQYIKIK